MESLISCPSHCDARHTAVWSLKHFCVTVGLACALMGPWVHVQAQTPPPPAFVLGIEAPDNIRTLLERHLDLLRYREQNDLNDSELDRLMVDAARDARDLVATLGYFSADVRIERQTTGPAMPRVLMLTVDPGPPTLVNDVQIVFSGPIVEDAESAWQRQQIQESWPLRTGMRFSQQDWDAAKQQALRQLTIHNYPSGQVAGSSADIDTKEHLGRLVITLDSGPRYRLGKLVVTGLQRHDAELVTRLARLEPGAPYAQTDLVAAQQRLVDSGFFDSAYVSLNTAGDPAAAPVLVEVREALLQKLVLGVGISTDAGPRLSAEHTHHKIPGIGWRAASKLALDRETRSISTELLSRPDADNWRWLAAAQLQRQQSAGTDISSQRLRAGRSQALERADRAIYAQYDRADSIDPESALPVVAQAISANYAVTLRNFDSTPFPSRGWGLGLEVGGGTTLGAEHEPYSRVLARALTYLPLERNTSVTTPGQDAGRLAVRAEVGAVWARDGAVLPSTQLFLTGGDTSVRGYTYRDIGVSRSNGVVTPGRFLATGSVEWQRPIMLNGRVSDWESTLFMDAGAVADQVQELRAKIGVGAGVRWKSPIGPLQIDLAYGLEVKLLRLHMNVGFSF